ncbi:HlyD family efflux transporter periplasmic adaptor subunit [Qingshengfaniella alkalisoli]|uniref:HlyD family efflux transporter periplasmic adaptor subunit n=1 Tax=Qingshengfaniella alkalisoli TaxID=2599296 RepID=UPI00197C9D19|nr:HlyD family efflux transporter periplasmic adaptor subunit [Qingshengfaniella alkalisoli]
MPPLREDLQILRGGPSYSGAPVWLVHDPLRNRFFRVTYEMFQILSLWNVSGTAHGLKASVERRFGRIPDDAEIRNAAQMLEASAFQATTTSGSWRRIRDRSKPRHGRLARLLHGYLFFKVPLVRPDGFIRVTWPYVAPLFSRGFLLFSCLVGLLGLYLVSRQWEDFIGTFPFVFSFKGAAVSLLSIALVKSLHEMGHAYTAHRYGCRVPTMGVAFMVMMPLLYTDVTDAWKLKDRRRRLAIDAAGIATELCVGAFALFLWAFLPDGPARSAVFVLAATSWLLSLLVNLNPFMRFDGYYLLSDAIGIENLQTRGFRHMRWRLREFLFRLGHPPPEPFPRKLDVTLTLYAIGTAIYRFFLFLGIALLVYHFTFKVLGVILFLIEIGLLIVRPVFNELGKWWELRGEILASARSYITLLVLAGLVALAAIPLSTHVRAPAMAYPEDFTRLYPPEEGRIDDIHVQNGQRVAEGEVLFTITSESLANERHLAALEADLAQSRIARIGANPEDRQRREVLAWERGRAIARRDGFDERQQALVMRAPQDAVVSDLDPTLSVGQWVGRDHKLALLSSGDSTIIRGYLAARDRGRVSKEAVAQFIPDDLALPKVEATLTTVSANSVRGLDIPELAASFGGGIADQGVTEAGRPIPTSGQYAVSALVRDVRYSQRVTRGVLLIAGEPESFLERAWRQVLKVLVREAGL